MTTISSTTTTKTSKVEHWTAHKFRPVKKTHGGKYYLSRHLCELAVPVSGAFVDVCVGGGSFPLNLARSKYGSLLLNDLDPGTAALWDVMCHNFGEFKKTVADLNYTDETFCRYRDRKVAEGDTLALAIQNYVVAKMSRGGMGKAFAWSERKRGGMPGDLNAWLTGLHELDAQNAKLSESAVLVTCDDAIDVIDEQMRSKHNFLYIDPPYPKKVRTARNVYSKEPEDTNDQWHKLMLARVISTDCEARVMISSYHNEVYDRLLKGWRVVEFDLPNNAGQGKTKDRRTEVVYLNY